MAKNRIEVSPAEPFLCTKDGAITPEFIAYTEAFARGGAGIVYVGDSPINQEYADENHYTVNLSDPFITHGLFSVADAIHRYGALAGIELNLRNHVLPADMTIEDIHQIIRDFTNAASYSAKAGFDLIMLHGGHGHTIAQFYSPQLNKRTDEYGCGTFENRCRFAKELLDSVRAAVGPNVAIDYRISGDDLTPGGVGVEDALRFAREIESRLDMIHVSAGNMYYLPSMSYTIQNAYLPMATNARFAKRFREELSIPVTAVGSFNLELAESALSDGTADVVAMIRHLIADPDAVNKARDGRGDEIRPCLRCCICTGDDPHGCPKPLRCSVNPVMGRNPRFDVIPPCRPGLKAVIVGGGAAGLEAARRLRERGASVVLFEKEDHLGGTLIPAGANRLKVNVRSYADWSVHTVLKDTGIDVRLGREATRQDVMDENPDVVIVAVGSEPFVPDIPGFDRDNVVLAQDVDMGKACVGQKIVLIGAGLTGTETAVALAQEGKEVTLIDMLSLEEIDRRAIGSRSGLMYLRGMAQQAGVRVITGLRAKEVTDAGLTALDSTGSDVFLPCDTVVLSMGVRPRKAVADQFAGTAHDVFWCGDCAVKAGNITSAVRDAFYAAMNV
ncbi:MAG: FAD-dependent oxidoreductase [Oscillospiraceae bacterium]|nr:FAD-dependent oxidoreductase [Oscillospiraceae bacterium]